MHPDDDPFDACAYCGDAFDIDERYPVESREAPDGTVELYSFCDEHCHTAWEREC